MPVGRVEKLSVAQKFAYLSQHGAQPASYLTTQEGFSEFHLPGVGYASFASHLGANLVLGDPICDPRRWPEFIAAMRAQVKKPTFVQVSRECALVLGERFGYTLNTFAVETDIPLAEFSLKGNKKNNLRYAIRQGEKQARVVESDMAALQRDHGIVERDLARVFRSWMGTRTARHQLKFLIRPPVFADEPGVRKFYAIGNSGELLGFVFFSPMYRDGKLIGFYNDINVAAAEAPSGLATYITLTAIEAFRRDGVPSLNLGASPLAALDHVDGMPKDCARVRLMLKAFYHVGNSFYSFKGSHAHKHRYHGREYPVFIATSWPLKMIEVSIMSHHVGLLEMKNMPGIKQMLDIGRRRAEPA
jgi:phosphatidylglycerol lysyltransferase